MIRPQTIWRRHGTKLLGYVTAAIPGLLGIENLIPKTQTKFWLAAAVLLGLLVVRRGHTNSKPEKQQ